MGFGIEYETNKFKVFFGNKKFGEEHLIDVTKQMPIQFMNQSHSAVIEDFSDFKDYNCDGLTTTQSEIALAIRTADCLPIVIH